MVLFPLSETHGTSSHHCKESGAGTPSGKPTSLKRSGWYWTGSIIFIYSSAVMPVKIWTAVLTVSQELSNVALEVEAEYGESLVGSINSISIGWCDLDATMTEEDVISIGINKSRRWLTLKRERC